MEARMESLTDYRRGQQEKEVENLDCFLFVPFGNPEPYKNR